MTVDQVAVGMRVLYTGDSKNFGEDWTIPYDRASVGIITKLSDDERWDVIVKWDKAVRDFVAPDDPDLGLTTTKPRHYRRPAKRIFERSAL